MAEEMDGSLSGYGSRKLFLGGLRFAETEQSVEEHFKQFGEVESVLIPKDKTTGKPRGFGFVLFKEPRIAMKLASSPHNFNGRNLDIKIAVPRSSDFSANGNFPTDTTHTSADSLQKRDSFNYAAKTGLENPNGIGFGRSDQRQTGEFRNDDATGADIGLAQEHDSQGDFRNDQEGPLLHDNGEINKNATIETNRIFVGGLPDGVTNQSLKEYFSKFGNVTDSFVLLNPQTKRPRGFGFITFEDLAAVKIVLEFSKHVINGKRVETRRATVRSSKSYEAPQKFPSFHQGMGLPQFTPNMKLPYTHSSMSLISNGSAPNVTNSQMPQFYPMMNQMGQIPPQLMYQYMQQSNQHLPQSGMAGMMPPSPSNGIGMMEKGFVGRGQLPPQAMQGGYNPYYAFSFYGHSQVQQYGATNHQQNHMGAVMNRPLGIEVSEDGHNGGSGMFGKGKSVDLDGAGNLESMQAAMNSLNLSFNEQH